MDDPAQVEAYAAGDFAVAHQRVADELVARFPELRDARATIVDLGCGPGDMTARVATACPGCTIVGVDGGPNMVRAARRRAAADGREGRIRIEQHLLPSDALAAGVFDAVVSNSLLHHLADPMVLWSTIARVAAPGAPVVVVDLARPVDEATADAIVEEGAGDAPEALRRDFARSLRAAYTVAEVADQLRRSELRLTASALDEHHLIVSGRR